MESLPAEASNYNNTALTYFSLHQVTNDKTAYKKGVDLMSKAVELRPDESILISNAASTLVTNSLYETLDNRLDYNAFQSQPSFSSVSYHYSNAAEKEVLREKIKPNEDFQKAIEYLKHSILLSPNNAQNYRELYNIYYFLDDRVALEDLVSKMSTNQVDVSVSKAGYLEYLAGADDDKNLTNLKAREAYFKKTLSGGAMSPVTKAAIQNELSENLRIQVDLGNQAAASDALRYAQAALDNHQASNIKSNLFACLMTNASLEAAQVNSDFKALRAQVGKSLSDATLVTLMLNTDTELSSWLRSNDKVQKAVALKISQYDAFPDTPTSDDWALFRTTSPNMAKRVANEIKNSTLQVTLQDMSNISSSYYPETAINKYWLDQIMDKPISIESDLQAFAAEGISIPKRLFPGM